MIISITTITIKQQCDDFYIIDLILEFVDIIVELVLSTSLFNLSISLIY